MRLIIQKLVFSNFFVACCVLFLFETTNLLFQIPASKYVSTLVFLSSFSCYNLMNLTSNSNKKNSTRKKWLLNHKKSLELITIITSLISVFLIIKLNFIVYFFPLIVLTFFYTFSVDRLIRIICSKFLFFPVRNYVFFSKNY